MSPSDVRKSDTLIKELEQLADRADLTDDEVRAIVSATTRLYANASAQAGREVPPLTRDVTTTDAPSERNARLTARPSAPVPPATRATVSANRAGIEL